MFFDGEKKHFSQVSEVSLHVCTPRSVSNPPRVRSHACQLLLHLPVPGREQHDQWKKESKAKKGKSYIDPCRLLSSCAALPEPNKNKSRTLRFINILEKKSSQHGAVYNTQVRENAGVAFTAALFERNVGFSVRTKEEN